MSLTEDKDTCQRRIGSGQSCKRALCTSHQLAGSCGRVRQGEGRASERGRAARRTRCSRPARLRPSGTSPRASDFGLEPRAHSLVPGQGGKTTVRRSRRREGGEGLYTNRHAPKLECASATYTSTCGLERRRPKCPRTPQNPPCGASAAVCSPPVENAGAAEAERMGGGERRSRRRDPPMAQVRASWRTKPRQRRWCPESGSREPLSNGSRRRETPLLTARTSTAEHAAPTGVTIVATAAGRPPQRRRCVL